MKITRKVYDCLEYFALDNRSLAENNPLNLVEAFHDDDELQECFKLLGREDFIDWINTILDENE